VIAIAPLQAYASALVFSPEYSRIRELFKKEVPDWIISKPKMEANWDACLQTLEGHDGSVRSVVFSVDGQRLASSSNDKTVKIWDSHSGECLKTLEGHDGWVRSVVFSADGQRLASSSGDNTVKVWDVHSGECLKTLKVNRVLTVDSTNNHCLYTEMGPLKLNLPPLPLATDGQTMITPLRSGMSILANA
jgi:WD40 repeat protein